MFARYLFWESGSGCDAECFGNDKGWAESEHDSPATDVSGTLWQIVLYCPLIRVNYMLTEYTSTINEHYFNYTVMSI